MDQIKHYIINNLYKLLVLLCYITIGLIGKFGIDRVMGKKVTKWQVLGSIAVGLFVGYISASICVYNGWEKASMIVVPMSTMLSEKLTIVAVSLEYKKYAAEILQSIADKFKK